MNDSVKILLEVVDKATPELQKFQQNLSKTGVAIKSFAATAATMAVAVAGAVVAGMAAMVKKTIDAADAMDEMSQRTGVSVESLSALAYAAKFGGITTEQLEQGLTKLNKSIAESSNPLSEAAVAFKSLGVEVKNNDGTFKSADQVFASLSDKFAKMPDGVNKVEYATALFGQKIGTDLIPMLNLGAAEFERLRGEAEKAGLILSTRTAKQAGDFNDSMARITNALGGVALSITSEVLPKINVLANKMVEFTSNTGAWKNWAKAVGDAFAFVIKSANFLWVAFERMSTNLVGLTVAMTMLAKGASMEEVKAFMKMLHADNDRVRENWKKFNEEIDRGAESTAGLTTEMDKNAQTVAEQVAAAKEKAAAEKRAAAERDRLFKQAQQQLEQEKSGVKDMTSLERIRYQVTEGSLTNLLPAQKQYLLTLAQEVDAIRLGNAATQERISVQQMLVNNIYGLSKATAAAAENFRQLQAGGVAQAAAWQAAKAPIDQYKQQLMSLNQQLEVAVALGQSKQADELRVKIAEQTKGLAALEQQMATSGMQQIQQLAQINRETQNWSTYIGQVREETKSLAEAEEQVWKWLSEGTISAREFALAMKQIDAAKIEAAKKSMSELDKKTTQVAGTIQSALGDALYNVMQGNFKDIGTMFKQMLDKMVAEALAAKLAQALFGDFQRTGQVSGSGGGLLTGLVGTLFGGMFRADGGPVTAGQPYIVGEKRPELFVPRTSGTILPDTSALAMAGGNSVQLSITAMDSQDVIRALDKIKRPLADMVNSTGRAYNMR